MDNKKKILVIGSANVDMLITAPKMPEIGETIIGSGFTVNAGGKGFNQAVALSKLGGNVTFLGAVGNDENSKILAAAAKEYNVNYDVIKAENSPTGVAVVTVVNSDNFIVLDPGANGALSPALIDEKEELLSRADIVVLQLEIPVETVLHVCKKAKKYGSYVVLNPAPYTELPAEIFSLIDLIIPNEHEAEGLCGFPVDNDQSCIKAIESIKDKGIKNVIITLGKKGCVYNDGDRIVFRQAEKSNAVDTTSAGDTFIGGFCVKMAENKSFHDAVEFATKAASITVSRKGAAKSIPYFSEIQ
jgi:ribokinase